MTKTATSTQKSQTDLSSPDSNRKAKSSGKRRRTLRQEIRRRVLISVAAAIVYVLSIGPMYWTYYNAKYNTGTALIAAIYEPLYLLCGWIPWLAMIVDAYVMLWIS